MDIKSPDFAILNFIVLKMEEVGSSRNMVRVDLSQETAVELNNLLRTSFDLGEIHSAADRCLAHNMLEHTVMGAGKYGSLAISQRGVGIVQSKRASEQKSNSRTALKKASDYIEEHKGLFVFIGVVIALATLAVRLFGGSK